MNFFDAPFELKTFKYIRLKKKYKRRTDRAGVTQHDVATSREPFANLPFDADARARCDGASNVLLRSRELANEPSRSA